MALMFSGCNAKSADSDLASVDITKTASTRTNETLVLVPSSDGTAVLSSDVYVIDYSNSSEGYITFKYNGSSEKVKLQLTGPDQVTYTYNIYDKNETVFPLSAGSGSYTVTLFESIGTDQYATSLNDTINVDITNVFGPFLYPNQYVNFTADSAAVLEASSLTKSSSCDLEAIASIYNFVISNVTYDKEEAANVQSNYLPDVDEVLSTGKGICFDYAALMASMLRSQGIPTRLEIGYAKDAYHAWISVYTEDQGWIGGIISFDGTSWTLMDPTLASNKKNNAEIKSFIGDGSSYTVKYMY